MRSRSTSSSWAARMWARSSLVVGGLLLGSCVSAAQRGATRAAVISGVVLDSASGRPIIGALVNALPGRTGPAHTDSTGHFRLDDITWDEVDFDVYCSSQARQGKLLVARHMATPAGTRKTLRLLVDGRRCIAPLVHSVVGTFRGHYRTGFEESGFRMCADSASANRARRGESGGFSDDGIWVRFSPDAARRPFPEPAAPGEGRGAIRQRYVRWTGTLTGPGRYGQMGSSAYEIVVDSVLFVSPTTHASDCAKPPERGR